MFLLIFCESEDLKIVDATKTFCSWSLVGMPLNLLELQLRRPRGTVLECKEQNLKEFWTASSWRVAKVITQAILYPWSLGPVEAETVGKVSERSLGSFSFLLYIPISLSRRHLSTASTYFPKEAFHCDHKHGVSFSKPLCFVSILVMSSVFK